MGTTAGERWVGAGRGGFVPVGVVPAGQTRAASTVAACWRDVAEVGCEARGVGREDRGGAEGTEGAVGAEGAEGAGGTEIIVCTGS